MASGEQHPLNTELPSIPKQLVSEFEAATSCDAQFEIIRNYFQAKEVTDDEDIKHNALYYLRGKQLDHLIVSSADQSSDTFRMRFAVSGKALRPLPREKFLEMGKLQKLFLLTPKTAKQEMKLSSSSLNESALTKETPTEVSDTFDKAAEKVLDMGAFTQLADAAQRSGIVPGVDAITHVRDREFRLGDYVKAFQTIERLNGKFSAAATQRQQRLRREEMDIKSGKIKMSPKELQAKRARDIAENQKVERARAKFSRVMEGLRVLVAKGIE